MIHDPDSIPHRHTLTTDRVTPGFDGTETEKIRMAPMIPIEPECPFPAGDLAEHGAPVPECLIKRCFLHRPAGPDVPVGKWNGVLQIIEFDNAPPGIFRRCPVAETPRIPGGMVPFGFTCSNPFGDRLADRGRMGDADLDATGMIEIGQAAGRSAKRQRVR